MMHPFSVLPPKSHTIVKVAEYLRQRLFDTRIVIGIKTHEEKKRLKRVSALPGLLPEMRFQSL